MRSSAWICLVACLLAIFVAPTARAQQRQHRASSRQQATEGPRPIFAAERVAAMQAPDPCIDCDAIYAGDCGTGLWRIDPVAGTSVLVGQMPVNMFDIAITSDGRLFGISGLAVLYEISACDASAVVVRPGILFSNGLTGDASTADLYSQGPPLRRIVTSGTFPSSIVGGSIGPGPPFWCGPSSGDMALNPADGLLYSVLTCSSLCFGSTLVAIDPATGEVVSEIGCPGGGLFGLFGLAFDRNGDLWGGRGSPGANLVRIDLATGAGTSVLISGGYNCAFGLASCPGAQTQPAICPHSQGFWRNHAAAWPLVSLMLGAELYDQSELLEILRMPIEGDASLILAHQLIAAKLNVANGSDPVPADPTILGADTLLAGFAGTLPYEVHPSSSTGQAMTADASLLDDYNNQILTPGCFRPITAPLQDGGGGGCAGAIGVAMPPIEIFGGLLPYLLVALVFVGLRTSRRRRGEIRGQSLNSGLIKCVSL
ncbi:MAG: hypothetical protein O7H41_05665 [Planctomycetota bacterium]|nr:hypothetical protein [Planctomycetota bacterium]